MADNHTPLQEQLLSQATKSQTIKRWIYVAVVFHLIVFVVAAFGLPHWRQPPMDLSKAVSVDLVAPRGEFSAAPNKTKFDKPLNAQAKPKDKPTPAKAQDKPPSPVQSDAAQKDDIPKPDQVQEQPKPKPTPPTKNATKPADTKVNLKPKKTAAKDDNKGKEQQQQQFNSILKNLLSNDDAPPDGNPVDAPVDKTTKESGAAPVTSDTLSLSDMDALKYQLAKCWNIPSGAMNAEDLIVDIKVEVNPDRTVKSAEIVDTVRYASDSFFAAAADSARRAMFNPQCTPLALPPDKYDTWKNLLIRFNPKDMFGG